MNKYPCFHFLRIRRNETVEVCRAKGLLETKGMCKRKHTILSYSSLNLITIHFSEHETNREANGNPVWEMARVLLFTKLRLD